VKKAGLGANESGELTQDGMVAYYDRHGGLAEDARRLGVGSLDDFVTGTVALSAEMDPLAGLEGLCQPHRWLQRPLKLLSLLCRSSRDAYVEFEAARTSELFPQHSVPAALTEPAWLSNKLTELQKSLADGEQGLVPELRKAVNKFFGEGHPQLEHLNWRTPQPTSAAPEVAEVPVGTLKELEGLRREVELLRGALSNASGRGRGLGLQARKECEAQAEQAELRVRAAERDMEAAVHGAVAALLRAYDGTRELVQDVAYIGVGNARLTLRARLRELGILPLLKMPEGRGELHPHTAALREKRTRVQARKQVRSKNRQSGVQDRGVLILILMSA
jgi:hypothetical protein